MTRDRRFELIYFALAWELWAEGGPYKDEPKIVREIRIQAAKLLKMLDNADMGISYEEMLGRRTSLSVRKKRGKLHVRTERQYRQVLECVDNALRAAGEQKFGRALTRKELQANHEAFRSSVMKVIALMKEKYPIESLVKG